MTRRRRALLRDLANIAAQLADDEAEVLPTIAARVWVGQTRYGCLDIRHDRRDLRQEGFEELCDGCFYQMAEVAVPRDLFGRILERIARLRPPDLDVC